MISKEFFISTLGSVTMHGALLVGGGWFAAAQFAVPTAPTAMEISLQARPYSMGESGLASEEACRRNRVPTEAVGQASACRTASVGGSKTTGRERESVRRPYSEEALPDSSEKKGVCSKPIPGADVTIIHIGTDSKTHSACPAVNPPPLYPRTARRQGIEGTVLLSVVINSAGKAENVSVVSSSGSSVLDEAAQNSIRRWVFIPARRLGTPVLSEMTIPVVFKLKD